MQIRAEPPNERCDSYEVEVDVVVRRKVRVTVEVYDQRSQSEGAGRARAAAKRIVARPGVVECLLAARPTPIQVEYLDGWAGEAGQMPQLNPTEYIELGAIDEVLPSRSLLRQAHVYAHVADLVSSPAPPPPPEPRTVITGEGQ